MARYQTISEPISRLAIWARRLAIFSVPAALMALVIVRIGILEIVPALVTFASALVLAVIGMVLAVCAFVVIWKDGTRGAGAAVSAIAIGLTLVSYPAYLAVKAYRLPDIADITTDPIDPPHFEAIARLRNRYTNPAEYAGLYAADQQRIAYPDIEPLAVSVDANSAYEAALAVVTRRKWVVVDARAPVARRRDGRIEAIARTPLMGFRDDVVVRVRASGQSALIDVRSASRYGRHDFGTNAARVRGLLEEVDDLIDSEKPEKTRRAVKGAAKKAAQPSARPDQPARR